MRNAFFLVWLFLACWRMTIPANAKPTPVPPLNCGPEFAAVAPKKPARGASWLQRLSRAAADERKFRQSLTGFAGPAPKLRYLDPDRIRFDIPARPRSRRLSAPYVPKQEYIEIGLHITRRDGSEVRIPVYLPPKKLTEFRGQTLGLLTDALTHLPEESISATKGIFLPHLNSKLEPKDIERLKRHHYEGKNPLAAAASDGTISIYANAGLENYNYLLRHEHGHNIAQQIWSTMDPGPLWEKAVKRDRLPISTEASLSTWEDFAIAVSIYLASKGTDGRDLFKARYEILDQIFDPANGGLDGEFWQNVSAYYALQRNKPRYIAIAGTGTILGATAAGYWLSNAGE